MPQIGLIEFPGINKIISASFTWSAHGTAPSACVVEITPQQVFPAMIGTMTFTFSSCLNGRVDFNFPDGYGQGTMNLTRLTVPEGVGCTQ